MEELSVKGLVVKVVDFGENDKLLTLITEEKGKITVTAKGGKSLKNRFISITELFTYAVFDLRKKSKYFYIYDGELIEDFYPVREDLVNIALASYICEVLSEFSPEEMPEEELLKLTLNTLYALSYKDYPVEFLKACFEFKAASLAGFMPILDGCGFCSEISSDMFIDVRNGILICKDCLLTRRPEENSEESTVFLPVSMSVIGALRFLEDVSVSKFLSFRIADDQSQVFYNFCEKYLLWHIEKEIYTLKFYKSVL